MRISDVEEYQNDLRNTSMCDLPWKNLQNKTLLISGITGLIGSYLTDLILFKNETEGLNCSIIGVCRDQGKAVQRFGDDNKDSLQIICSNINELFDVEKEHIDYVLHLASNTHPVSYSSHPIDTIKTNIVGTTNMLEIAKTHFAERFVFASSNEIYGENLGDTEFFDEDYLGYINCNSLRAGYPESKRCGEALCQAYINEMGMDIVIPRFTRSYGPTMLDSDTKAISQFIKNAVNKERIVLKSKGDQYYSYTYVGDAVIGLLTVLLLGKCGEAYNISDGKSDITIRNLASMIAEIAGTSVITQVPDELERAGYSKATKARLNGAKLKSLGWKSRMELSEGLGQTISILRKLYEGDDT